MTRVCRNAVKGVFGFQTIPLEIRIQTHTRRVGDCIEWTGSRLPTGYGYIRIAGRGVYAHRFFFERAKGPIPPGLHIDHLCRNTSCVNPDHLEAVTQRENTLRGINPAAENARKTHCKRGHPLSGDNLQIKRDGARLCRKCVRRHDMKRTISGRAELAALGEAAGADVAEVERLLSL